MLVLRTLVLVPVLCLVVCSLIRLRFSVWKSVAVMGIFTLALAAYGLLMERLAITNGPAYLLPIMGAAFLVFFYLSAYRDMRFVFSFFTELSAALLCFLSSGLLSALLPLSVPVPGFLAEGLLLLACGFLVLRYLRGPMLSVMENGSRGFGALSLIPVLFLSAYVAFLAACMRTPHGPDTIVLHYGSVLKKEFIPALALLVCFLAAVYVTLIRHFHSKEQLYRELYNRSLMEFQVSALQNQCMVYDTAQEKMSGLRHDMRHHVAVLSTLLGNGQAGEAAQYLSELGAVFEETKVRKFCLNPAVNSVLSVFAEQAGKERTTLHFDVDFPKEVPLSPLDLGVVLSNALENAINACRDVEPGRRGIWLKFRFFGDKLIFEVRNPYTGNVVFDKDGLPLSTREGHGTGSRSIAAFAKKYHSTLDFKAQDGMFTLRLLVDGLSTKG
ncbi:ATP-binding protein [Lacrimispora sp. NSJ-141]|uniref:ATP-binding protein n=1 Tax=Lientehia hominis TaxID=2897778 RepID=A0AAP2RKJ3_9FIRM|nr:ATP-binding protein [Lientehia hominis]MCD2493371.1 ATP-binding protein [Lientehia hominis]